MWIDIYRPNHVYVRKQVMFEEFIERRQKAWNKLDNLDQKYVTKFI